jgi:hypothetical protein
LIKAIVCLDSQVNSVLVLLANAGQVIDGGPQNPISQFVLAPTFQSLNDAIDSLLDHAIGGTTLLDIGLVPAMHVLSDSLKNVSNVADTLGLNQFNNMFTSLSTRMSSACANAKSPNPSSFR